MLTQSARLLNSPSHVFDDKHLPESFSRVQPIDLTKSSVAVKAFGAGGVGRVLLEAVRVGRPDEKLAAILVRARLGALLKRSTRECCVRREALASVVDERVVHCTRQSRR